MLPIHAERSDRNGNNLELSLQYARAPTQRVETVRVIPS